MGEQMSEVSRKARGGKTIYGAKVGILMLETQFPRIPGDTGNAATWPFPVLYKVVRGATPAIVIHKRGEGLKQALLDAAAELVKDGADGITSTGGFLSIFQKDLAEHTGVPVASSALMQIPLAQALLPPGKRVGVITIFGSRLTPDHLTAVGAPGDTPIVGTENGKELSKRFPNNQYEADFALIEEDVIEAGRTMLEQHPDVGAFVLECHNMAPYSWRLQNEFNVPVFDVYTLVTWFQSALQPRNFGYPGTAIPPYGWRER